MLKPITTSNGNGLQPLNTSESNAISTTTQNTDSILSPTALQQQSLNLQNIQNLQNVQLNQSTLNSQNEDYLDLNNYMTQVNLNQLALMEKQNRSINGALNMSNSLSNNTSAQNQFQYYLNNSNPDDLNDILNGELNNNNPLALNNNLIANATNNLQFNDSIGLLTNANCSQLYPQSFNLSSNLNSNQQRQLKPNSPNLQTNRMSNSSLHQTNQTRSKPHSVHIKYKFGRLGNSPGALSSPHGFCLGLNEEIIIADTFNHRVCILDKTGHFIHQFGNQGKNEGQLWYPRKV